MTILGDRWITHDFPKIVEKLRTSCHGLAIPYSELWSRLACPTFGAILGPGISRFLDFGISTYWDFDVSGSLCFSTSRYRCIEIPWPEILRLRCLLISRSPRFEVPNIPKLRGPWVSRFRDFLRFRVFLITTNRGHRRSRLLDFEISRFRRCAFRISGFSILRFRDAAIP